jgi:hypothetical protein
MTKEKGRFVLCLKAGSYKASLEPRKVYRVLEDSVAEAKSLLRVVDESGEDYLFPAELFVAIEIPENAEPAFTSEASTAT